MMCLSLSLVKDWHFPASFWYHTVQVFTQPLMVLWYLMKPWEVVRQHLLEAMRRKAAPSPKLE